MKRSFIKTMLALMLAAIMLTAVACGGDTGDGDNGEAMPNNPTTWTKFEAESADLSGVVAVGMSGPLDTPVEDVATASGGKSVGYMSTEGNFIVFNINSTKKLTNVTIRLSMSSTNMVFAPEFGIGEQEITSDMIDVKINGTSKTFATATLPAGEGEGFEAFNSTWGFVTITGITLNEGNNVIRLEPKGYEGVGWTGEPETVYTFPNFDYLEIGVASSIVSWVA